MLLLLLIYACMRASIHVDASRTCMQSRAALKTELLPQLAGASKRHFLLGSRYFDYGIIHMRNICIDESIARARESTRRARTQSNTPTSLLDTGWRIAGLFGDVELVGDLQVYTSSRVLPGLHLNMDVSIFVRAHQSCFDVSFRMRTCCVRRSIRSPQTTDVAFSPSLRDHLLIDSVASDFDLPVHVRQRLWHASCNRRN